MFFWLPTALPDCRTLRSRTGLIQGLVLILALTSSLIPLHAADQPPAAATPPPPEPPPATNGVAAPAPTAEPPAVVQLRNDSLKLLAEILAARAEPLQVDLLIEDQPKLVTVTAIDAENALHYKQFGRAGQVAFADLTAAQIAGVLAAALVGCEPDGRNIPEAHLHAGLLFTALGKSMQASSEIATAIEAAPELREIASQKLKQIPPPPSPPSPPQPAAPVFATNASDPTVATTNGAAAATAWPPPEIPWPAGKRRLPGLLGPTGPNAQPNRVESLTITQPGCYENYRVDGQDGRENLVNIKADHVILRNSEICNSRMNGVQVYAKDVLIENCRIHHLADGTLKNSVDAHGITGCPTRLVIRNCEIFQVSGDGIQFDPDRNPWTDVVIEHCEIWIGPLDRKIAGYQKDSVMGENAIDTKTPAKGRRARLVIRHSVFHGWTGSQASAGDRSALNLKENIDVTIENCLFYDNNIGLRLRGPGDHGGAQVTAARCYFYQSATGIRYEDNIRNLSLTGMAFAPDVKEPYDRHSTAAADKTITGDCAAPAFTDLRPPAKK